MEEIINLMADIMIMSDTEQKEKIDEVVSVCNMLSAKYGEIAHEERMRDGIQLVKEIFKNMK